MLEGGCLFLTLLYKLSTSKAKLNDLHLPEDLLGPLSLLLPMKLFPSC